MGDEPLTPDARSLAADLFVDHAKPITARLAARFPGIDPQTISDAVIQAILELSSHFDCYDSQHGSLASFLSGAARRILGTILRTERRRRRREQKKAIDPVTAQAPAARSILEVLADRDLAEQVRTSLHLGPEESRALELWLIGERDIRAYAIALGLGSLTLLEQEKAIRRWLARIRQRLHRLGVRLRKEEGHEG